MEAQTLATRFHKEPPLLEQLSVPGEPTVAFSIYGGCTLIDAAQLVPGCCGIQAVDLR